MGDLQPCPVLRQPRAQHGPKMSSVAHEYGQGVFPSQIGEALL